MMNQSKCLWMCCWFQMHGPVIHWVVPADEGGRWSLSHVGRGVTILHPVLWTSGTWEAFCKSSRCRKKDTQLYMGWERKGAQILLWGVYSLTGTIGNGKTMLTFRSPKTFRRPLASETVSDWMELIVTKYNLYILKCESCVIPPSNKPCARWAPEPNIESVLPNAVIKEGMVVKARGK